MTLSFALAEMDLCEILQADLVTVDWYFGLRIEIASLCRDSDQRTASIATRRMLLLSSRAGRLVQASERGFKWLPNTAQISITMSMTISWLALVAVTKEGSSVFSSII